MNQLLLPLSSLKRVGPTLVTFLTKLVGQNKVFDLLLHKPTRAERISILPRISETENGSLIIIKAKVESHIKPATNRQPYKVICYTTSGYITLVFFKIFPSQIAKMPIGSEISILGTLQKTSVENQISHPQEILPANQIDLLPKINVIYPLSTAISQKFLTQKIHESLSKLDSKNEEWIDENLLKQKNWPEFSKALKNLHYFASNITKNTSEVSRQRLAYDELLAWQFASLITKNQSARKKAFVNSSKDLSANFISSLPFKLTNSQLSTIKEISSEISSTKKMLRLLQGDVGSGKTIVAILACLKTISQDKQTCLIVPTAVLAKQHLSYFKKLLKEKGINIEILIGSTTKKQKNKIIDDLYSGKIDILISTHAALEDNVKFKDLGLAIIDEQHRFGVIQRLKLVEKGADVDVLLMSATPIPRSLMMGLYGDMDISILNEKPKNRQEIETLVMSAKKIGAIYEAIERTISRGEKIYWVCPAIDENEEISLVSAKQKFSELGKILGEENIALLHGKMKESEKEKIMNNFIAADSDVKLLVATTVIEVGIDVPDATVMVIENSEHFGLSQLHQLRGRVGRSDKKSYCILLYGEKYGLNGQKRLNILRQSNDGFFIAEEDLKMRGSGELLGTKQSGFPEFRIADLSIDSDLLKTTHKQAKLILNEDLKLEKVQNLKYKNLLLLFGYDEYLRNVNSG